MTEQYEIPKSWVWTNVGDLYDIKGGGTPSTKKEEYWDGAIPWITSADIHGIEDIRPRKTVTEEGIRNSATNLVPKKSIIVVTRVSLGKLALTKFPLCFSQDSQALVGNKSLLNPKYALYYLSLAVQKFRFENRGTTISGVTKKQLRDLVFPLAPVQEQERIATEIDDLFRRLDAGVKLLTKSSVKIKQYRSSLLRSAFRGDLTAKWRESNQYPPVQNSESTPEWLPDSWSWLRIGDITEPSKTRFDPKKHGSIQYLGLEHIESDTSRIIGIGDSKVMKSTKSVFNGGDVLYGRLRPYLNKVVVPEFDGVCSTDILVFPKNLQFSSRYLAYVFLFPKFVDFATKRMTGVQHPRIQFSTISKYEFPFPPPREQEVIVEIVEKNLSLTRRCKQEIGRSIVKSSVFRSSILQQAFQGQLVPQDPSEGHAQEILNKLLSKDKEQVQTRLP